MRTSNIRIIVFEFIRGYAFTNPHTFSLYWGSGAQQVADAESTPDGLRDIFPRLNVFSLIFFVRLSSKCVRIECDGKKANSQRENV